MADQRSVMKEYRLLEQKRQAGGLSAPEEARFAQLRDLVGPETGVAGSRPGFDVNAAAARLRESLLPAGLRNRPPPPPEAAPPPAPPEPAPEAPAEGATGLEAVWDAAPFAPLGEPSGLSEDALFDPGTLGLDAPPAEPTWDAAAQPYDPNAQPYDAAAQQWDPNAQPYDPNAPQQWDPNAQPYDPGTQGYDPNAPQQWDASAQPYDPNAQPYDASAQQWDAAAQPYDPNAPQPWDASAAQGWETGSQPYDPNAQPYDAGAQQWDPNAQPQWDAAVQPAWDPNLAQPWGEQPGDAALPEATAETAAAPDWTAEGAPVEAAAQPWETEAAAAATEERAPDAAAWDTSALPAEEAGASPPDAPPMDLGTAETPPEVEWGSEPAGVELPTDLTPEAVEPSTEVTAEPFEEAPLEPALGAEPEAGEPSAEPAAEPFGAPSAEPLPAPAVEELLPFDAEAASAVVPEQAPEGWGAAEPSVEIGMAEPEPPFVPAGVEDGYGDLAGPEQPSQLDALPSEQAQDLLAPLGAGQELTSDDDAFAQGFQLESNGSFGAGSSAAAPAWSAAPALGEQESWESAPAIDLGALAPATDVPPIDFAPTPPNAPIAPPPTAGFAPPDTLEEIEVEEIPIVEGADLLEELPPAPPVVLAPPSPTPRAAVPPPPPPAAVPAPPAAADVLPVNLRVEGVNRVVVHTIEGQVKRGVITDVSLDSPTLPLAPQPDGVPEPLASQKIKAIFFMLAAGEKPPVAAGKKVRVTFNDGRQIAGFSPDYSDAGPGFFMIPADTRTNTGRIWVYRAAVKTVTVS